MNESESDFESNSTNDMQQNKKHKTDKTKKPSSKLIQLTYQQAIDRIRQYLTTKKAITTSSLSIRKKATYPLNSIRKGLDESFLKLYDKETECDIDLYKKNNWYQVIHSLYESFEFVIYDRSHFINGGVDIHQATRLKLIFPKEKNMFLLFSGYLAHNGAAALQEKNVASFNFMNSLRLFSYVDKKGESFLNSSTKNNKSSSSSSSSAHKTRNSSRYVVSDQAANGTVEHANTKLCNACDKCKKVIEDHYLKMDWKRFGTNYLGEMKIDLLECFKHNNALRKKAIKYEARNKKTQALKNKENPKKKQKTLNKDTSDNNTPLLIAGGIAAYGWAVFEGVDVSNEKYYPVIDELEKSVNARGFGTAWKSINNPGKTGERNMLQIQRKKDSFPNTLELFKDIQSKLNLITGFNNCELQWDKVSILKNKGNVQEQIIHRDQANYNE